MVEEKERQVPCSPLEWDVFKRLVSDMGMAVAQSDKSPRFMTMAKYQTVISIGGYVGLRGSDLLALSWDMLLTSKETFEIEEGKTKKRREITLNDKCRNLIKHNHKLVRPLYDHAPILHNKQLRPISLNSFNDQLAVYFQRFKVVTDNPSSHTLRKTFGLRFFEVHNRTEHALILLMQLFNHSTLEETIKYIGITKRMISNGYKMLD